MGFFKTPEEMYDHAAKRFKKDGDMHWAKAKNGEGEYHYGAARKAYKRAEASLEKAKTVKGSSLYFIKKYIINSRRSYTMKSITKELLIQSAIAILSIASRILNETYTNSKK